MEVFPNESPEHVEEVLTSCSTVSDAVDILSKQDKPHDHRDEAVMLSSDSSEENPPSYSHVLNKVYLVTE